VATNQAGRVVIDEDNGRGKAGGVSGVAVCGGFVTPGSGRRLQRW
jgi:hypothetical protein